MSRGSSGLNQWGHMCATPLPHHCNDEDEVKKDINSFEIIKCLQLTQGQSEKRLVYVRAQVDEEIVAAMVDSGTTSSFISLEEA
ncbi:unnamed protein product [Spirodela intermedia]|uniref:Uncharacterized protein n=1 Tax=Spirodela intermedia TaxID=51605 RepID=A0A7I8L334_SPIIN|nr:unnamed protein product [Spirodela intermedia]